MFKLDKTWKKITACIFLLWLALACGELAGYGEATDQFSSVVTRLITPFLIIGGAIWLYFLPTITAKKNQLKDTGTICVLNIFLGWTLVGWVVAMAWAVSGTAERYVNEETTAPAVSTATPPQSAAPMPESDIVKPTTKSFKFRRDISIALILLIVCASVAWIAYQAKNTPASTSLLSTAVGGLKFQSLQIGEEIPDFTAAKKAAEQRQQNLHNKLDKTSGTKATSKEQTFYTPIEHIVAPGGNVVYYIMTMPGKDADGNQNMRIAAGINGNSSFDILLTSAPSNDPAHNLTDFSHLFLSPDSKTLYFQTEAWATSNAIHAINLATKKVSYVAAGSLRCVILSGQYQGDLVVEQHRYYAQGGSYNALWLYDPSGKEINLVSQDTDASQVCPSLGN